MTEEMSQIERFRREIQECQSVDDAHEQRLKIEAQLRLDPFTDHLYTEQQFDKLCFFELRKLNENMSNLIRLLSPSVPECRLAERPSDGPSDCILESPEVNSAAPEEPDENLVPVGEGQITSPFRDDTGIPESIRMQQEPVDPDTGIHQVESDGLSPAERDTLAFDNTGGISKKVGRPAGKGRR